MSGDHSASVNEPAPGPCPDMSVIDRLANGEEIGGEVTAHVRLCAACGARLHAAIEDAAFVGRARELVGEELGPIGSPRIPGYRVLQTISAGAQGVVYKAVQESTSRLVAIKTFSPGAGGTGATRQRHRAEREVEILAKLRHRNVVAIHESRPLSDGRLAVVMEFVPGVPLDRWTPSGETATDRQYALLRVFIEVCAGVHHAHLNGVIHRDLKPENILVTRDERGEARPVVVDFGIAKIDGLHTMMTGEFAGTPAYASPEQVAGRPEAVDALTDVYSLGVILYRLLAGAMPYDVGGSIFEIAKVIQDVQPVPPRDKEQAVSSDLSAVVLCALRKEKERRYQSAAAFAQDLQRCLVHEPVQARSDSGWYLLRKAVMVNRRRLAWVGLAAAVLIAGAVALVMSQVNARELAILAEQRREQARAESVRARAVTELLREALPNEQPQMPDIARVMGGGLGRLYYRLETNAYMDDPEVDQELRRLWGSVYTGFGGAKAVLLIEYAEVSLRSGLVRLKIKHGPEHPEIAATMHQIAGVLLVRKRLAESEQWCADALAMREKLLGESVFTEETRALLARIVLARGDASRADELADRTLAAARRLSDQEADLLIASMCELRARIALDRGASAGASASDGVVAAACEAHLLEALRRRCGSLPVQDTDMIATLSTAADFIERFPSAALTKRLVAAWGPAEGESIAGSVADRIRADLALYRMPDNTWLFAFEHTGRTRALLRYLRLQENLLGEKDMGLVVTLISVMRTAEGEYLYEPRIDAALRAAAILKSRFGERDLSVLACLQQASVILLFAGRGEEAVQASREAVEILRSVPAHAQDGLMIGNAERYLGFALGVAGRHEEAIKAYEVALATITGAVGEHHHTAVLTRAQMAMSMYVLGRLEDADRLSREATEFAETHAVIALDQAAHIYFVRGHILVANGRLKEGGELLRRSVANYYDFVGPRFPWFVLMMDDLAAVARAEGNTEQERHWLAQKTRPPTQFPTQPIK